MNARVLFVKVAISSVLLQHHPLSQVHASNSNVARTENSRYLSSAAYEFANNQVKLPVFSLLAGDAETLALHGVGSRKSDEVVSACGAESAACKASNHSDTDIIDISSGIIDSTKLEKMEKFSPDTLKSSGIEEVQRLWPCEMKLNHFAHEIEHIIGKGKGRGIDQIKRLFDLSTLSKGDVDFYVLPQCLTTIQNSYLQDCFLKRKHPMYEKKSWGSKQSKDSAASKLGDNNSQNSPKNATADDETGLILNQNKTKPPSCQLESLAQVMERDYLQNVFGDPNGPLHGFGSELVITLTTMTGRDPFARHAKWFGEPHAQDWTFLTIVGHSDYAFPVNSVFDDSDHHIRRLLGDRVVNTPSHPSDACVGVPRGSAGTEANMFHYPSYWPFDVVIPGPTFYSIEQEWRSIHHRNVLFYLGASTTHCSRKSIFDHYPDILYFGKGQSNLMIFYNGKTSEKAIKKASNSSQGSKVPLEYFDSSAQKSYSWGDFGYFMRRSKFCAVMDGQSAFSHRFIEALAHGCVPVVISDSYHPPLSRAIDWSRAPVIFLRNRHIPYLREILESIPEDDYAVLQLRTFHFAMMLDEERAQFWELLSYELMIARLNRENLWTRCILRWPLSFTTSSSSGSSAEDKVRCFDATRTCYSCCRTGRDKNGNACWEPNTWKRSYCCPPT